MGRRKKRKRGRDKQQRHIEGRILPLLYPSSRLCTLHDLLIALILPSLQDYHAPPSKPAALSSPSPSLAGKGPEVLLHTKRAPQTDMMGMQQEVLQQDTRAAVASPPYLRASQAAFSRNTCQDTSPTSANNVLQWKPAATSDANLRKRPTLILEMDATLLAVAHSLLIHEGDPADYLSLLYQSYGVLPDTAPPIGRTVLEQRWSHQQVIDRVIQILFKQGRNSSNVLCFGFQQPRPRSLLERERTAPAGLTCVTDNAAVRILNSQTWRRIHSRVGDLIMLHLLSYADIFHPLPHKCYLQVTGTSVLLSTQQSKKPSTWILPPAEGSTERRDTYAEQGRFVGPNIRDSERLKTFVYSNADSGTDERSKEKVSNVSVYDGNATSRKRRRPHSWQRRKLTKSTVQQAEEERSPYKLEPSRLHVEKHSQGFPVRASELQHLSILDVVDGDTASQGKISAYIGVETAPLANFHKVNRSHKLSKLTGWQKSSEPNQVQDHMLLLPVAGPFSQPRLLSSPAALDGQPVDATEDRQQGMVAHGSRSLAKQNNGSEPEEVQKGEDPGMPSTSNTSSYAAGTGAGRRFINRSRMFYRGKFPHHAGLPKNHLLQRLKPTYKDAGILFEAIFGKENLMKSNTCREWTFVCLKKCSKCICCLLKELILNTRKCQFTRFLKRHCSSSATRHFQTRQHKVSLKDVEPTIRAPKGFVETEQLQAEKEEHSFCSHNQVVAFIWAACRQIVPEELLGSKRNWRILRRNVYDFVSLRKYESFSLAQGMFKLRLSEYSWCPEPCLQDCCLHKKMGKSLRVSIRQQEKLDLGKYGWLVCSGSCPPKSHQLLKMSMLEHWIFWLFSGLIVPLIQAHFYVTESEKFKQNVLFYRKSVWAKLKASAVKEMVKCNFKKLSVKSTFSLLKTGSLGFSRGRLLPKKVGTRLIANLGSSSVFPTDSTLNKVALSGKKGGKRKRGENLSDACYQKFSVRKTQRSRLSFKPINLILRDIHNCLKYEQENHEEDLGCSVFDYNDAYLKLLPYIIDHKRASNANATVYLVVCDAFKAFDTIRQDKLLDIVREFVREDEYCVRRFGYASRNMKSVKVFYERSTTSTNKRVTPLECFLTTTEKQSDAVCVDLAYSVKLRRSHVLEILKEHILRNILHIGQHYYLQVVGIPQGSVLSCLLCSLYYGHFERSRLAGILNHEQSHNNRDKYQLDLNEAKVKGTSCSKTHSSTRCLRPSLAFSTNCVSTQSHGLIIHDVTKEQSLSRNILLRLVDDWLLISNSKTDALEFVRRMHRGFTDYNCFANRVKTAINFDASIGDSAISMNLYRTQDGACFIRWSGLLVNCNTLEIQADYTRYCGVSIRSTLTVWRRNNEGIFLKTKLCQFMRPKCHPIFYDGNINCPATVFLNAYQAFVLCAMKFHAYICSLPCRGKCSPRFGLKAVLNCARYMHSLLVHRTQKLSNRTPVKPLLLLQAREAQWLALHAFHMVLMRKQSRYTKLLYLIKAELSCPKYEGLQETPLMLSALDARRSSMFESILY